MRNMKKVSLWGWILCGLFLMALAFANDSWSAPPEKELKIGCIVALSGPGAAWGIPLKTGLEIGFEEINAAGGIKTSKVVYKPRIFAEDDQLKGELGITKLNKLLYTDRIDPIVYILASPTVLAAQSVTTPRKIVTIFGGQTDFEPQKNPYTFRSLTFHYMHQDSSFKWFKENLPAIKKVALLSPDYSSGRDCGRVFKQIAKKYDYQLNSEDYFLFQTTDFTPILTKLLPKNPDMLNIGATTPGQAALIVKQARELGFTGPIYGATKQDIFTIVDVAGAAADNFYSNILVPDSPGLPQKFMGFYEKYVKRMGKWQDVATMTHRTAYEIKAAIEAAGSLEPDKLRDGYKKIKMDSVDGPVHYGSPYGTQAYYPVPMARVEKGKPKFLGIYDPGILTEAEYHWKPEGSK